MSFAHKSKINKPLTVSKISCYTALLVLHVGGGDSRLFWTCWWWSTFIS